MKLSIIIVSYDAADFLRLTLNAVYAACEHIDAEIFVVDNASLENLPQWIAEEFPHCKLIANKTNPGFAAANNQAILKATGQYILILNPDTIVGEDTFIKAISFMDRQTQAAGMGIRMLDGSGCFLPESKRGIPSPWTSFTKITGLSKIFPRCKFFGEYHKGYLPEKKNHPIEILAGSFMLFTKDALNDIGLLDEEFFMYGEDIDLSYRAIKNGYQNYYFSDVSIIHFKGESTIKDKIYINRFYRAMIQFANKHYGKSYGSILKIFIFTAIFLIKSLSLLKYKQAKKTQDTSAQTLEKVLLLQKHLPSQDLMDKLQKKYDVQIVQDLTNHQEGTLIFVQGSMRYSEMIYIMDLYKTKFKYRFLDPKKQVIIGSDHPFSTGFSLSL